MKYNFMNSVLNLICIEPLICYNDDFREESNNENTLLMQLIIIYDQE